MITDTTTPGIPLVIPLNGSIQADRGLLGGKGWGLQEMHRLGIPVPPAFTLTTRACTRYFADGNDISDQLWAEVIEQIELLERRTGARFGATPPLLVSVRSGAPVSMPGMMDTLLNVGITDAGLAWLDTTRQSLTLRHTLTSRTGVALLSDDYSGSPRERALGELRSAITQIFDSWHSERARIYRQANRISDRLGTAVTVQAMVFGNLDARSGTGVYVTRNPINGKPEPFGEWLATAQGEELVSGDRTPAPLTELQASMPEVYDQLIGIGQRLERLHCDAVEIEFTIESGSLYLLQVRNSSSSRAAAARWAVDLVRDGVIDISEALTRVPEQVALNDALAGLSGHLTVLAEGIGVSPGVRAGRVVCTAEEVADLADLGEPIVLARPTTSTHDLPGFLAADGVLTENGGSTSHAAVVARQLGLPCVVGCGSGVVDRLSGQLVTIDGEAGHVYAGDVVASGEHLGRLGHLDPFVQLARWRAEAND